MYEVAQPYFSNQDISWIKKGVEKVVELKLKAEEKKLFNNSVKTVKTLTNLAQKLIKK